MYLYYSRNLGWQHNTTLDDKSRMQKNFRRICSFTYGPRGHWFSASPARCNFGSFLSPGSLL